MKRVATTLACLIQIVNCAVYYVEPAPVAPLLCTLARPCRIADLPTTFTTADTVVFLPATTGVVSTFTLTTSLLVRRASASFTPGTRYTGAGINVQLSTQTLCTSASFENGATLTSAGVTTVESDGCNYTNAGFITSGAVSTVTFKNAFVRNNAGGTRVQIVGNSVTVLQLDIAQGSTSVPALTVNTGAASSNFHLEKVKITGSSTTSAASLILVQSISAIPFSMTLQEVTISNCNADGALVELRSLEKIVQAGYMCTADIVTFASSGSSTKKGLLFLNAQNDQSTVMGSFSLATSTGDNFNNGGIFYLDSNTGNTILHADTDNSVSICSPTNQNHLAVCETSPANTAVFFEGNVMGSSTTQNCPVAFVVAGNTC
jgi:hypothetical protein